MGGIAVVQPQRRAPRVPTQFLNLFLTTTTEKGLVRREWDFEVSAPI